MGSSPDNDEAHSVLPDGACSASETERYTYRNQCLNAPQANPLTRNLADMGQIASRTHPITDGVRVGNFWAGEDRRQGGHGECPRRNHDDDAGA